MHWTEPVLNPHQSTTFFYNVLNLVKENEDEFASSKTQLDIPIPMSDNKNCCTTNTIACK